MLDKILKMFFIKKQEDKNSRITVLRKIDSSNNDIKQNRKEKETVKETKTCLSHYFSHHRGLNLVERGFTYSLIEELHNN